MLNKKVGVTKRQLQAQATRNKIYKTALKLFSQYNYDSVTIDDIVEQSGVSKGSFYTHFKSKEHIMLEQFKKIDAHYERWFKTFSPHRSASDQLLSFVRSQAIFVITELRLNSLKVVYTSQISLTPSAPKLLSDDTRPYYKIISAIIALGKEQGEFRVDIPTDVLASMISRIIRGLFYDWCLFEGSFDLEEESQRYFGVILDMLRKRNC